jgi:WD40 repeat protein
MNLKSSPSSGAHGQRVSWSALVGYDLFISYRRSDATRYAAALFEALRLADFRCFLDDNDATPGKPLTEKLQSALKRSKVLLIVASPDLPLSTWVPKEVELFLGTKRDIILINVKGGMTRALASDTLGPLLNKDVLWIDEQSSVEPSDAPSAHVIGSVQKNFNHRRANRNLRFIAGTIAILFAGFAVLAGWEWRTALARLQIVQSEALAAEARRVAPHEPFLAIKTAIAAFATSDTLDAETALLEGLSRVPSLKLYLPCAEGQKAVGVAFSDADKPLLGYACLAYGSYGQVTTLRFVDLDGVQKSAATVPGDARNFSFIDSSKVRVVFSGRTATLDVRTGPLTISSQPAAAPPIASPSDFQVKLDEVAAPCLQKHPYGTRYFVAAPSTDGRLLAYTTEANQIVIADMRRGECAGDPLEAHTHNVLAIAWSSKGRYLATAGAIADGDNAHGVALWDREQISLLSRSFHSSNRLSLSDPKLVLSTDGSSWLCGACEDRIIWNGQPVDLPVDDLGPPSAVTLKPDGREAAVALSGVIYVIRRNAHDFSFERKSAPSRTSLALTYASDTLYAGDEALGVWNVSGQAPVKVSPPEPVDSVDCFDSQPAGPYFLSETHDRAGKVHLKLTDLKSGEIRDVPVPSSSGTCAAVTFSPGAKIAVRTTTAYRPFLVVHPYRPTDIRRISNPLRQAAGLQTILRNAHLSYDGRRLVASSDNSGLAIFELATERLIGSINLGEVQHVALAADGKTALVEGGGKLLMIDLDPSSWYRKARQLIAE